MYWDYDIHLMYPAPVVQPGDPPALPIIVRLPSPLDVKVTHKFTINSAQLVDGTYKSKLKWVHYFVQMTWVVDAPYMPEEIKALVWNGPLWPDNAQPMSFDGGQTWYRMTLDGDPVFTPVGGKYVGFELVVKMRTVDPITRDNYYANWHLGIVTW
jgi:hypothetical protein